MLLPSCDISLASELKLVTSYLGGWKLLLEAEKHGSDLLQNH